MSIEGGGDPNRRDAPRAPHSHDASPNAATPENVHDHATDPDFVNIYNVSNEHQDDVALPATEPVFASAAISEKDLEDLLHADEDGNIRTTGMRESDHSTLRPEPHVRIETAAVATEQHASTVETVHAAHPEASHAVSTVRQVPSVSPIPHSLRELLNEAHVSAAKAGVATFGAAITIYAGSIFYLAEGITKLSVGIMKAFFTRGKEGITKAFSSAFAGKGGGHGHDAHGHGDHGHGGGHGHEHAPKPAKKASKKKEDHGHGGHGKKDDHGHGHH